MNNREGQNHGNIGGKNLASLQNARDLLSQERENTRVDRFASYLDSKLDGILMNGVRYPRIAKILREQIDNPFGVDDRKYYLACAQMIVDQGLVEEDESGFKLSRNK